MNNIMSDNWKDHYSYGTESSLMRMKEAMAQILSGKGLGSVVNQPMPLRWKLQSEVPLTEMFYQPIRLQSVALRLEKIRLTISTAYP